MGKATAFSTSDLNTVFFSTYDMEGVKVHQGVARLISYQIDDKGGLFTQGPGYYGRRDEQSRVILPANGEFHLDPSFRRENEQFGTDIYILGFNDNFEDLKISVLDGFFYAIHSEKLIVKLDDEVIDKNTLEGHINSLIADNTMVKEYFACLKNPDLSDVEEINWKDSEGTYHLYLKMGDNYHCQIAQIRSSGMKIFDDKKPVDSVVNYCGILVAEGINLNGLLKASENPAHTYWTIYRAKDAGYDNAKDVIIEARKKLVSRALAQYKPAYKERVPLYINRRLAYSDLTKKPEDKQDEKKSLFFDKKFEEIKTVSTQGRKTEEQEYPVNDSVDYHPDDNGELTNDEPMYGAGLHNGGNNSNTHGGDNIGDFEGNSYGQVKNKPSNALSKCHITKAAMEYKEGKYALVIHSEENLENINIKITVVTETSNEEPVIKNAKVAANHTFVVKGSTIYGVSLDKETPTIIHFEIDRTELCSLEVTLYEH